MKTYAFRLHPHQDLKVELVRLTHDHGLQAGMVLTCVGSLEAAAVRLAGQDRIRTWDERLEIVSLVGTLSLDGVHLHMAVADGDGRVHGGHLVEGCCVFTTVEIVVGELEGWRFLRRMDPETGHRELVIEVGE